MKQPVNKLALCGAFMLLAACGGSGGGGNADTNPPPPPLTPEINILRMSLDSNGVEGDGDSDYPAISADGRYVAFESGATNLVENDGNGIQRDIFVRDQQTGETTLVSVSSDGTQGNGWSYQPAISADGRFVAFYSNSSNLVSDDTNSTYDIFVHELETGVTVRASVDSLGQEGIGHNRNPAISADGRYVVFESDSGFVLADTNFASDIYRHDLLSGETILVSRAMRGSANDRSHYPTISADGRYVAFYSHASNLVNNDTNSVEDVFVYDIVLGSMSRQSVNSRGEQADGTSVNPSISADGRYVAFYSQSTNLGISLRFTEGHIYVHDRMRGETRRVSMASMGVRSNGVSSDPSISADGRFIAFYSDATNLADEDNNGHGDIFVHDTQSGHTVRVSVNNEGEEANDASELAVISADGRYVAFHSGASNLVEDDTNGVRDIFRARVPGLELPEPVTLVSASSSNLQGNHPSQGVATSTNGRYAVFFSGSDNLVANDTNGASDVFLRDTESGVTTRVSVASDGTQGNGRSYSPDTSADGRYVVFSSEASNLVPNDVNGNADIFLHDTQTGTTRRISVDSSGNEATGGNSYSPAISADGRYVVYMSVASNLVAGDTLGYTDIFLYEVETGITERISISTASAEANFGSSSPAISADGQFVVFQSGASNLVANDMNNENDIFIRDTVNDTTTRASVDSSGAEANGPSFDPNISANGRYVGFWSEADNLVADDNNFYEDTFVYDMVTGVTRRVSLASDGGEADNASDTSPSFSVNGRYVAFYSDAENLVANDLNSMGDIFVRDMREEITVRVSIAADGSESNDFSGGEPAMSADGRYVLFYSPASNLHPRANNGQNQIFRVPVIAP